MIYFSEPVYCTDGLTPEQRAEFLREWYIVREELNKSWEDVLKKRHNLHTTIIDQGPEEEYKVRHAEVTKVYYESCKNQDSIIRRLDTINRYLGPENIPKTTYIGEKPRTNYPEVITRKISEVDSSNVQGPSKRR